MDMHSTIITKSDQLNADDLIGREMTIKITGVNIKGGQEQPVSISFEGDNGKPYKACKSMCRVMVTAWGADSAQYVGRSMTLYRDPTVKWGGLEVGGIRISHMSHIDSKITLALTMTRANKKPYTVKPLADIPKAASPQTATSASRGAEPSPPSVIGSGGEAATISPDEALKIEARCTENGITVARVKAVYGIERFSQMTPEQYQEANEQIDVTLAKRKYKTNQ